MVAQGPSHLDESEIWIVKTAGTDSSVASDLTRPPAYQQVTKGGAKDAWPMFSGDGRTLYFMSDRSGAQNIWSTGMAQGSGVAQGLSPAKALTAFKDGRVLWPSISKDGKTIAFERDFGIWTVDTAAGQPHDVPITLRGAPAAAAIEHRTFSDQIQELAVSPGRQEGRLHRARRDQRAAAPRERWAEEQ